MSCKPQVRRLESGSPPRGERRNAAVAGWPGRARSGAGRARSARRATVSHLRKFARSLCENIPTLQASGHPKWREVELALPALARGWIYYPPMVSEMQSCLARKPVAPPVKACEQQQRILGLCK
jgi:hypothetical protein